MKKIKKKTTKLQNFYPSDFFFRVLTNKEKPFVFVKKFLLKISYHRDRKKHGAVQCIISLIFYKNITI